VFVQKDCPRSFKRRRQIGYLVTIFNASVDVNLKVIAKISNAEFQPRIYQHYVFDIGDRLTTVKCLPIAAESFRWMSSFKWRSGSIFQMDGGKAKLSEYIFADLDDAVERRYHKEAWSRIGGGKLCQTKHWINLNLSKACYQIRKNIMDCEARFQRFDLLWYRFDLFRFQNIPARHHTYLECWQHVVNAPNISQSYLCIVRATHNSNSWA